MSKSVWGVDHGDVSKSLAGMGRAAKEGLGGIKAGAFATKAEGAVNAAGLKIGDAAWKAAGGTKRAAHNAGVAARSAKSSFKAGRDGKWSLATTPSERAAHATGRALRKTGKKLGGNA